jgi:ABC-type glycerol-3-phosphate transport system substrate-binding protein
MPAARCPLMRFALSLLLATAVFGACGRADAPPTATSAPVAIRFAFKANVGNYIALADAFHQKYPNITVQLVSSSTQGQSQSQTLGTGLSLTLLKMQAIDAFRDTIPYMPTPDLVNALLPLDEYITADKAFPSSDFLPGLMNTLKIRGTQVGVPAGVNPIVAYYDAYRLRTANANPPAGNWTLDDFLNIAEATNNQSAPSTSNPTYVIGLCSDPLSVDPIVITYLMGGQMVDSIENPTRPTMDSAANVRAMQWYASLRFLYGVTPNPAQLRQGGRSLLYQVISLGRCGVWIGFYGDMRGKAWGTSWLGDPVMMPLPRGQSTFNAAGVDGYFMLRYTPHPQETWLWLTFLLDHEAASGTQMPPLRSQIQSQSFAERVTPDVVAVARSLPATTTILSIGLPQDLGSLVTIYLQAVARVVNGEADAKNALSAAQENALLLFAK